MWDTFDDAFTAIARGGAGMVEVGVRLQKAFQVLASMGDATMREAAMHHSRLALARAENVLVLPEDLEAVKKSCPIPHGYFFGYIRQESDPHRAFPSSRHSAA